MKTPSDVAFSALQRTALHTASLLVPGAEREDWSCEWLSELWHVRSSYLRVDETISLQSQGEITWFCLGAFADALCVRELAGRCDVLGFSNEVVASHNDPVKFLHECERKNLCIAALTGFGESIFVHFEKDRNDDGNQRDCCKGHRAHCYPFVPFFIFFSGRRECNEPYTSDDGSKAQTGEQYSHDTAHRYSALICGICAAKYTSAARK